MARLKAEVASPRRGKLKGLSILLALALVLSLGIVVLPMAGTVEAQGPTEVWVATTGDNANSGNETAPFRTIQKGINTVAEGGTVNVAAGTYLEYISISKPLTVRSTAGAEETIIDGIGFRYMVQIYSSDVTLQGFTVTNPTYAEGSDASGILIQNTSPVNNVQILNNIVKEVRSGTSGVPSSYGATGINIGTGPVSNVVISGNTITNIKNPGVKTESSRSDHTCGINVWAGGENITISNNTISDIKYNGIILEGASNVRIENNTMITECESGIRLEPVGAISNIQIRNNPITKCESGITVVSFEGHTPSNVTVNHNNFADNSIQVFDGAEALVIEDVLRDNFFDRAVVIDRPGDSLLHTIWSKIQDAIDAASDGDTINVAAGTYNETVEVNKELTLQGEGRDVVTVTAADDYVFKVTAHNVTISGFNITGARKDGICLDKSSGNTISDNEITDNDRYGICLDKSSGNTISDNEITDNGDDGIYIDSSSDNTISDNEITDNGDDGIYLDQSPDNTISDNEITDNGDDGIYIDSSSDNTISDNEITDNGDDGIHVDSDSSGNAIHFNNIVGNSSYGICNEAAEMVDAENNWWGDASGPSGVGHGTGDAVSENVDYSPWLDAPAPEGEPITFTNVKEETVTDGTLDAKDEADTEVVVDGSATVTVAKYSANPGSGFTGDIGKYIDVHIDDDTDVDELIIKLYYTDAEVAGLVESSLRLRWWDGDSWELCSDSGVNMAANYMWAKVRDDTTPSLSQLTGTPFAGRGTTAPVEVADVGPELIYLRVDFLGEISKMRLGDNNRLRDTLITLSPDGRHSLEIKEGTRAPLVDGKRIYLIKIREAEECPPLPEDTIVAGKVYDITPSGATFDKDVILILSFNPMELPENTLSVTMAYYVSDEGWVELESEQGGVAELGTMTAAVSHFTPFAILAKLAPPAPPPVPAPPPTLPAAHFVASGLTIEPSVRGIWEPITFVTRTGESVTITANVANDGGQEGTYIVELKINGETVDTKEVTLGAGQSQQVSFTLSGMGYGRYEVEVAGLSGEFTASRIINWWLIIGIIAAIGLITWGVIRGRRRVYS